jgi:hypothetical protein
VQQRLDVDALALGQHAHAGAGVVEDGLGDERLVAGARRSTVTSAVIIFVTEAIGSVRSGLWRQRTSPCRG